MPNKKQREEELEKAGAPKKTAELIAKAERADAPIPDTLHYTEDKRDLSRQEHSNHFTNRAPSKSK